MIQQLWIDGYLEGMNEIIEACKGAGGSGAHYVQLKRNKTNLVMLLAKKAKLKPMESAHFHYLFSEKTKRRDKSNVLSGIKFIEDGLVNAEVFKNDGWKQVLSITPDFEIGRPGVLVTMSTSKDDILIMSAMIAARQ